MKMTKSARETIEIEYWRDSFHEKPESDSVLPLFDKVGDAELFFGLFNRHRSMFPDSGRILEIGGGQAWASCFLKRFLPKAHITATDISPHALASLPKWERIWNARPDAIYACNSYETKEADGSVDLVFCFSAGHHFSDMQLTLHEIRRVLSRNGTAIFMYEPVTPSFFYPLAFKRVNAKRPECPEDVLVPSRVRKEAAAAGLSMTCDYYPSILKRRPKELIYYSCLRAFPFLQHFFPSTANLIFRHSP
jgi:SAM-dependent methyltransferase